MQLKTMRLFTVVLGLALTTASSWPLSQAQEHKAINLSGAKGLPFSDGIIAGNTLYVAGQEGSDDAGKLAREALVRRPKRRSTTSRKYSKRQDTN